MIRKMCELLWWFYKNLITFSHTLHILNSSNAGLQHKFNAQIHQITFVRVEILIGEEWNLKNWDEGIWLEFSESEEHKSPSPKPPFPVGATYLPCLKKKQFHFWRHWIYLTQARGVLIAFMMHATTP